jgi:hypothetical protein
MTQQNQGGGAKLIDSNGNDITAQVHQIRLGNVSKIVGSLDDEELKSLRLHGNLRSEGSSKIIIITGGGNDDDGGSPDTDF